MSDGLVCPLPLEAGDRITLAHGEGGRLMRRWIEERLMSLLGNDILRDLPDAAHLTCSSSRIALSTDSFVVSPLFFPGGDIGQLAVFGTVNDLAVSGAVPRWLSLALILEEGLPLAILERVLQSIADAARQCDVQIVTGDTKVVPRGAADQLFINTTGVGELIHPVPPGPRHLRPGDQILVSGPIGRHGIAVLCARESFGFEPPPASDCGPLHAPLMTLLSAGVTPRCVRDATRGGLAAVLHEWAGQADVSFLLDEFTLPVTADVRAACELLGLDPCHLANEGTFVAAVPEDQVEATLALLRRFPQTANATGIGTVVPRRFSPVEILRTAGRAMPLDEPSGAPLPRIC
jgi:hydrogenase expression/formation protein HypE